MWTALVLLASPTDSVRIVFTARIVTVTFTEVFINCVIFV